MSRPSSRKNVFNVTIDHEQLTKELRSERDVAIEKQNANYEFDFRTGCPYPPAGKVARWEWKKPNEDFSPSSTTTCRYELRNTPERIKRKAGAPSPRRASASSRR
jgi:hypothetical protein